MVSSCRQPELRLTDSPDKLLPTSHVLRWAMLAICLGWWARQVETDSTGPFAGPGRATQSNCFDAASSAPTQGASGFPCALFDSISRLRPGIVRLVLQGR